ncbi:UNVERIFIED_CONTAM: hypothetical protein FKN15_032420 [Acipenser sinensis]
MYVFLYNSLRCTKYVESPLRHLLKQGHNIQGESTSLGTHPSIQPSNPARFPG